ncbi:MAG: PAS domain-containing protein [Burkholderiales bacterium]
MKFPSRLSTRITLLVLAATLPALALLAYRAVADRNDMLERSFVELEVVADARAISLGRLVEGARQLLITAAAVPAIRLGPHEICRDYLQELMRRFPMYPFVGVLNPDGTLRCVDDPDLRQANLSERDYFRNAIERRDFIIGEFVMGEIAQKGTLHFSYPVLVEGRFGGVIFTSLDLNDLGREALGGTMPEGTVVTVADYEGVILFRGQDNERSQGRKLEDGRLVAALNEQGQGRLKALGPGGRHWLYAFANIPGSEDRTAYVIAGLPEETALAAANAMLPGQLLALAAALLIALVAGRTGAGAFVLRELRQLQGAAKRIASGNLNARVGISAGPREVVEVAEAFDEMAQWLEARREERDRAEAELRRSEALLAKAQQIAKLGSWERDIEIDRIYCSDQTYEIFDLTRALLPEPDYESFLALVHPEDLSIVESANRQLAPNRPTLDFQHRIQLLSGEVRWVRERGEVTFGEQGRQVRLIGTVQDITELKQAEVALRESEERFRALTELSADWYWEQDEALRFVNAGSIRKEPYVLAAEGKRRWELPENRVSAEDWARHKGQLAAREPFHDFVMQRLDRNGRLVAYVSISGYPIYDQSGQFRGYRGIGKDVTERERAKEEVRALNQRLSALLAERTGRLEESEALFGALTDLAPQVVWSSNADGAITYFSRRWYDYFGGSSDDWLGNGWVTVLHPEDRDAQLEKWLHAAQQGTGYETEYRCIARDGHTVTFYSKAVPVRDAGGRVVRWVGVDTDVTEHKRIEAELARSNQELEAFSYSVSHDLRSPLQVIDGFSEALEQDCADKLDATGLHYLQRIRYGARFMGQLIDDLLNLGRVSRAQLSIEPVSLSAICREIVDDLRASEQSRNVAFRIGEGLEATADPRLLRVALENLLSNAWKFSAKNPQALIEVGELVQNGVRAFYVRDNGAGFDMKYEGKLFGVFQRLHAVEEFPGTGVGLATVKRVVERHGGRIWVQAAPEQGATFFFTLHERH